MKNNCSQHFPQPVFQNTWMHGYLMMLVASRLHFAVTWGPGEIKTPTDTGSHLTSCFFGLLHVEMRKAHFRSSCYFTAIKMNIILLTQPIPVFTFPSWSTGTIPEENNTGFTDT